MAVEYRNSEPGKHYHAIEELQKRLLGSTGLCYWSWLVECMASTGSAACYRYRKSRAKAWRGSVEGTRELQLQLQLQLHPLSPGHAKENTPR